TSLCSEPRMARSVAQLPSPKTGGAQGIAGEGALGSRCGAVMHAHSHTERLAGDRRVLAVAAVLIAGLMAGEIAAGVVAGSLAPLADAGHLLPDGRAHAHARRS